MGIFKTQETSQSYYQSCPICFEIRLGYLTTLISIMKKQFSLGCYILGFLSLLFVGPAYSCSQEGTSVIFLPVKNLRIHVHGNSEYWYMSGILIVHIRSSLVSSPFDTLSIILPPQININAVREKMLFWLLLYCQEQFQMPTRFLQITCLLKWIKSRSSNLISS